MSVSNLNLATVQAALRYKDVHEVAGNGFLRFEAVPSNPEWPSAYVVLQPDRESGKHHVLQVGFGRWHEHFERYRDPDRNVGAALALLAEIMSGEVCLVAGCNDRGDYVRGALRPSSVAGPNIIHGVPGAGKAVKFTRYVFKSRTRVNRRSMNVPLEDALIDILLQRMTTVVTAASIVDWATGALVRARIRPLWSSSRGSSATLLFSR